MLRSVSSCQSVPDLNQARRDLFNQVYKRGISIEELDVGYEYLVRHAYSIGLCYHPEFRTHGPIQIEGMRQLLANIKNARFIKQFNQAYELLQNGLVKGNMGQAQYDMCHAILLAQADFQGYVWSDFQQRFLET